MPRSREVLGSLLGDPTIHTNSTPTSCRDRPQIVTDEPVHDLRLNLSVVKHRVRRLQRKLGRQPNITLRIPCSMKDTACCLGIPSRAFAAYETAAPWDKHILWVNVNASWDSKSCMSHGNTPAQLWDPHTSDTFTLELHYTMQLCTHNSWNGVLQCTWVSEGSRGCSHDS